MPRFAANLSMMYTELPFLDRFEAAARDGFQAVEFLFPTPGRPRSWRHGCGPMACSRVLFNAPPGGTGTEGIAAAWEQGVRGTACLPERTAEFRDGVLRALDYAAVLDCPRIHLMAGLLPAGVTREEGAGPLPGQPSAGRLNRSRPAGAMC